MLQQETFAVVVVCAFLVHKINVKEERAQVSPRCLQYKGALNVL